MRVALERDQKFLILRDIELTFKSFLKRFRFQIGLKVFQSWGKLMTCEDAFDLPVFNKVKVRVVLY